MRTIVVPLTDEVHALAQLAAGTFTGRDRAVSRFVAALIEAGSKARLAEVEAKKESEKKG